MGRSSNGICVVFDACIERVDVCGIESVVTKFSCIGGEGLAEFAGKNAAAVEELFIAQTTP